MEIAGVALPTTIDFVDSPVRIQQVDRASSGRANIDLIAIKSRFQIKWGYLNGETYSNLEAALSTAATFVFAYDKGSEEITKTVFVEADLSARYESKNPHYYRDISITLAEV